MLVVHLGVIWWYIFYVDVPLGVIWWYFFYVDVPLGVIWWLFFMSIYSESICGSLGVI
jgi:hypothetical protein